jgi:hypothetical protein
MLNLVWSLLVEVFRVLGRGWGWGRGWLFYGRELDVLYVLQAAVAPVFYPCLAAAPAQCVLGILEAAAYAEGRILILFPVVALAHFTFSAFLPV